MPSNASRPRLQASGLARGARRLVCPLLLALATTALALAAPPEVPPGQASDGQPAPGLAAHVIGLQGEQVALQEAVLALQASETERLEQQRPESGDPAGAAARQQLRQLEGQLSRVRRQLSRLMDKLRTMRPEALPEDQQRALRELNDRTAENARRIAEANRAMRGLVGDAGATGPAETTAAEPAGAASGAIGQAVPATVEEAADVVGSGEVKTPRHLLELFERVPKEKTPHGNLSQYRQRSGQ